MIKSKNLLIIVLFVFLFISFSVSWNYDHSGILSLDVVWIWVRHGTPNNLNLSATWNVSEEQEITGKFLSGFWIEDLLWLASWHYVTIQCDGLRGPLWSIITWIYIKAWNLNPNLVLWISGLVYISNTLNTFQSIYKPLVYIYKTTNYANLWLINRYDDTPTMKVVIPANSTAGTYNGIIAFTLYME